MGYQKFSKLPQGERQILGGLGALGGIAAQNLKSQGSTPEANSCEIWTSTPPKVAKAPKVSPAEIDARMVARQAETQNLEPAASFWTDTEEERAAFVEYDGGAPRAWAEGFARLDPDKPLGDVPPRRWLRFVDDCGRFLDGAWAGRAAELGWRPLDLFGCDRERPFARIDHAGLLWLLNGRKLIALTTDMGVIETPTGGRQTYRRQSVAVERVVLAWELSP
jgi:hypothetical protein